MEFGRKFQGLWYYLKPATKCKQSINTSVAITFHRYNPRQNVNKALTHQLRTYFIDCYTSGACYRMCGSFFFPHYFVIAWLLFFPCSSMFWLILHQVLPFLFFLLSSSLPVNFDNFTVLSFYCPLLPYFGNFVFSSNRRVFCAVFLKIVWANHQKKIIHARNLKP